MMLSTTETTVVEGGHSTAPSLLMSLLNSSTHQSSSEKLDALGLTLHCRCITEARQLISGWYLYYLKKTTLFTEYKKLQY